jgi:hypothetical protein
VTIVRGFIDFIVDVVLYAFNSVWRGIVFALQVMLIAVGAAFTVILMSNPTWRRESDDAETGCPRADVQLNVYEYELQRRRCEAVRHNALDWIARDESANADRDGEDPSRGPGQAAPRRRDRRG